MANVRWNEGQQQAIVRRGGNTLVAAGAGAGKTAVLAERVVELVTGENAPDISRLLVVTFTEAAAAEMRWRIGKVLHERSERQPLAARQAALLGQASISTIHSFCLKLIRRYFYRLGLDPRPSVMGEEESALLRQELYVLLLEEELEEDDGRIAALLESYGGSGGKDLEDLVLGLFRFARSHPRPADWLARAAEVFLLPPGADLARTPWVEPLLQHARLQLQRAKTCLREARGWALSPGGPAAYDEALACDQQQLEVWEAAVGDWAAFREVVRGGFSWRRLPAVRGEEVDESAKEAGKKARDQAKDIVKSLTGGVWGRDEQQLRAELAGLHAPVSTLLELVEKLDRRYRETKVERGQLDFADLEHYCLALLAEEDEDGEWKPSAIAHEIRREYDEVLVDEYQDINAVQDAILTLVSRQGEAEPNLFMVGDVKQSIYRFRLADPSLFLSRHRRYARQEDGIERRIDLVENYRSAQGVIDAVNFVFSRLMRGGATEVAYDDGSQLNKARQGPEPEAAPVQLHLMERDTEPAEDDELEVLEREAYLAGRVIQQLVRGEEALTLYDDQGHPRPATYRDVVILMRSTRLRANQVVEILGRMDIPSHAQLATGYFAAQEVSVMRSLLSIIDNPRQDIPLAAVLRSPVVGLSPEDLARIRIQEPKEEFFTAVRAGAGRQDDLGQKLQDFLDRLEEWRSAARQKPINQLVWRLLSETGYYDYCAGLPGGAQRQANLRALYERARQFDGFSHPGLFRFLRFLERLEEEHDLGQAPSLGQQEDVVRVMSVHKSKGLEFPVVVLLDAGKKFNLNDTRQDVLRHRQLGVGPRVVDRVNRIKYPSLAHAALGHRVRQESLAEEMRVLYVAMTRAQERLVIIGSARDLPRACREWSRWARDGDETGVHALAAETWLDWLGGCLMQHTAAAQLWEHAAVGEVPSGFRPDPSRWSVRLHTQSGRYPQLTSAETKDQWSRIRRLEPLPCKEDGLKAEVIRHLEWNYPHRAATRLPAKASVSDLTRAYAPDDEVATLFTEAGTAEVVPGFVASGGEDTAPDAATLGIAVHRVLSHIPLTPLTVEELAGVVQELVKSEVLLAEWAEHIPIQNMVDFLRSSLGQRLLRSADTARREVPFTLGVPAGDLFCHSPDQAEEVVVQGVVDCYFRQGDELILLDYKTDARGAATSRMALHRQQLSIYGQALEQATGLPVSEAYLVFLSTLDIVDVSESMNPMREGDA